MINDLVVRALSVGATSALLGLCAGACTSGDRPAVAPPPDRTPATAAPNGTTAPNGTATPSSRSAGGAGTAPGGGTRTSQPPGGPATGGTRTLTGRIEALGTAKITVTPPGGTATAAALGGDTAVYVAYGKCPDGTGPGGETATGGLGTLRCSADDLDGFLAAHPMFGDVTVRNGTVVKIVEHKGG